jgi:hypothetical protein
MEALPRLRKFAKAGKISILKWNLTMKRKSTLGCLSAAVLTFAAALHGQSPAPQSAEPVAYASVNQLNQLLEQLQKFSDSSQADLSKLRIERWKTDSNTRKQTQGNVDSLTRNLHDALPEMISTLRSSPENLGATFKLYRNLDALYDVFGSVAESAGAFGSKDEFQSLDNDLNVLEQSRRAFADRMADLASTKENEIASLRTKLQQAQAVTPATPVKKTVVDDAAPAKKPATSKTAKKKTVPKPPASDAANSTATPASNPNQ